MQFQENGFRPGNPEISEAAGKAFPRPDSLPEKTDVLIVGCGPAGLTLAAQLSAFDTINTVIIDKKDGPMQMGQADGIACRTMEMFEAFGFAEKILKESYWVNETTFWKPDPENPSYIARSDRIQDTEDGLSEFPHVILSQARVHDRYLEVMERGRQPILPYYSRSLISLKRDEHIADDPDAFPVQAEIDFRQSDGSIKSEKIQARFVIGCDGAHSEVRRQLGHQLEGDSVNSAWGVMDVLAVTDFPDIRMKSALHSHEEGSMLIIPREGGHMVRLYIEIAKLKENERLSREEITLEQLIAAAGRILHPFKIEVKETVWWSVYQIGQRVCTRFDDMTGDSDNGLHRMPRIFIAGDACHTHSPKAGQGMNVSMADAFNLGWKLAAVLRKQAQPLLLKSYSDERVAVAKELIAFDREIARLFSSRQQGNQTQDTGEDAQAFQSYFQKHARYTAGVETRYEPGLLTQIADPAGADGVELACGFTIGMRFHSAPVIRLADGKPCHLGHCVKADGRWRLFAFARPLEQQPQELGGIKPLCQFLEDDQHSPVRKSHRPGAGSDAVIDLRVVFQEGFRDIDLQDMPDFLLPETGCLGLKDYEKIFCADTRPDTDIFSLRNINRSRGCVIVVRPDQYVGAVFSLDNYHGLSEYFSAFMQQN